MLVSATAVPTPLPIRPGGSPESWAGRPLAAAKFAYAGRTFDVQYQANEIGPKGVVQKKDSKRGPAAFTRLESGSFRDAVEAASKLSSERLMGVSSKPEDVIPQATAVLQAGDGSFWVTALSDRTQHFTLTIDSHPNIEYIDISSQHPDLQAIVGSSAWVNFSDQQVSPDLAG